MAWSIYVGVFLFVQIPAGVSMKILLLLFSTSVFASHYFPFIGYDKKGYPVYTRGGNCYKVVDEEHEIKINCKEVRKTNGTRKN